LPDLDVDRRDVMGSVCCPEDHDRRVNRDAVALRQAGQGDLVLMKGERWPGNSGRGCVHRSPAVGPDSARVVLTLSWPDRR